MPGGGGVEVQESGRALKVHTDSPHLVSLGGGRFSTAVTLHPLPEGRRTLGSGPGADLQLAGTGVEGIHCHIENKADVVTLHPVSGSTTIDGLQVTQSTRLTQGCMICFGRSTCLRFNHPAEARLMKSVIPNSRISVVPFPFFPGEESSMFGGVEGKPPPAPRRSGGSQDSWGDLSSTSSEDLVKLISPKVFPAGSCTVNSPASLVLGSRPSTPSKLLVYNKSGAQTHEDARFSLPQYDKVSLTNGNKQQYISQLSNGCYSPSSGVESCTSVQSPASSRVTSTSSPCPSSSERGTSPSPTRPATNRMYISNSVTVDDYQYSNLISADRSSPCLNRPVPNRPLASPSPAFDRNPIYPRKSVSSPTSNWDSSIEDLTARKDESEKKRVQAQNDRLVAQEAERLEQMRLEEILNMCADYEKQVQWEKQNKPQQNRIKTNGSLPRDKRLCSPSSPQMHKTFNFDSASIGSQSLDSPQGMDKSNLDSCNTTVVDMQVQPRSPHTYENVSFAYPSSPRTRIKTILPSKDNSRCEYSLEVIENKLAVLNDIETSTSTTQSCNMNGSYNGRSDEDVKSIRVPLKQTKEHLNGDQEHVSTVINNNSSPLKIRLNGNTNCTEDIVNSICKIDSNDRFNSRAEVIAKSKYEFLGFDPRKQQELPDSKSNNLKRNVSNSASSLIASANEEKPAIQNDTEPITNENQSKTLSLKKLKRFDTCPSWTNPVLDLGSFSSGKRNGEYTADQLLSVLDSIERCSQNSPVNLENGKFILPLPDSPKEMADKKSELISNLTKLKAKVTDIEQQQEELMRELEMEQALLGGEWDAQNEKLKLEQNKLDALHEKIKHCDSEMERCAEKQTERQAQSLAVLEKHQTILATLEQQLQSLGNDEELKTELKESLRQQQELLEAEKKSFEDLEFNLLEEEAGWLSYREELHREVGEVNSRCIERQQRIEQLQMQRQATEQQANSHSHKLQLDRLSLLRQIEETRSKLKELDVQRRLQITQNYRSLDYDLEENIKKQSQDDLDRISRVTSGAPMEVLTNSLGRRTIASLQEIERNRQIHLAKQGSLVIEEERKRVSELKRRVQDEARAEWEERRQREHNCHSLNSVGSDESSLTSSDVHTESASSEEVEKRLPPTANVEKTEPPNTDMSEQRDRDESGNEPPSRPVSDASSYSCDQLTVRMRNKSNSNIQRPLTRYLPIRGESLDLRQHIESAGHQVDLCPHVIIDQTSCRGLLQKMTSRFHQWNKRWFVFDRINRTLTYYSDRSEKKPRGGVLFQAIEEVYVDHQNSVKSPNPQVTFVIKSRNRTYHLVAPSPEAMRIWVDVIFTGAEGYQEFCLET